MIVLGYIFTALYAALLIGFAAMLYKSWGAVKASLRGRINGPSLIALVAILVFFVLFSVYFVAPVSQLYFDENIYQGIAINILKNGNALWCQYGTGYLSHCYSNAIYHDAVEYSFYLAMAFSVFGISLSTAYAMQLFVGALSIVFVFLLASILFDKRAAVASTLVYSLMPELLIWSRTQTIPDLGLTAASILAFFCFFVFMRRKSHVTLMLLVFSMLIAVYMRIEGILLIPLFVIAYLLYKEDAKVNRLSELRHLLDTDARFLAILLIFILLAIPQVYYLSLKLSSPDYGQGAQSLFSIQNFKSNIGPNVLFFLGNYNIKSFFPAVFPPAATVLAVMGIAFLLIERKDGNSRNALIAVVLWIVLFHLFYDFFYAGSVTYGVDVRFMLQILPGIALLSGVALSRSSDIIALESSRLAKKGRKRLVGKISIAALAIFLAAYFLYFMTFLPLITMRPINMPQQGVIYPAVEFVYGNYSKVPTSCLVFTFTPDLWYEFNRSAAEIGYFGSTDPGFVNFTKNFSCFVLDYGYWCQVPPNMAGTCSSDRSRYNTSTIATMRINASNTNVSVYRINGYGT